MFFSGNPSLDLNLIEHLLDVAEWKYGGLPKTSAETVWCNHVYTDQNIKGMFLGVLWCPCLEKLRLF